MTNSNNTNDPSCVPSINHKPIDLAETMLSSEQAAVAFNLPYYFFRNPYKRKKLQIPHYYINKLVRYRLSELRVWHAQLGALLIAHEKEIQALKTQSEKSPSQEREVTHA